MYVCVCVRARACVRTGEGGVTEALRRPEVVARVNDHLVGRGRGSIPLPPPLPPTKISIYIVKGRTCRKSCII